MSTPRYSVDDLLYLMQRLRDPVDGCPWDVEQSYRTIAPSTIEEAYEVVDAIEQDNFEHLREELGDLLFQVIFYCRLGEEEGRFNFSDVASDLVAKLVRRHPHVFPDGTLESRVGSKRSDDQEADIKRRWEAIKQEERDSKGHQGVLADIPLGLPALTRAAKLQKRAANVGFEWSDVSGVLDKLEEEIDEVREALQSGDKKAIQDELGDVLFVLANFCRYQKVEPESALRSTNQKFEQRFEYIESKLREQNLTPDEASLELMDQLWDEAKVALKPKG